MKQRSHYQETLRIVNRIGRLTNPQHLPVLRRLRLSLAQFLVLDALDDEEEALRMSDLAEAAGLPPSELSRVVDELAGKAWVERDVDPSDRRARLVSITRAGARLISQAHEQASTELHSVWSDFTHEEWHRFTDYLRRFVAGLSRVRSASRSAPRRKGAHCREANEGPARSARPAVAGFKGITK